MSDGGFVIKFNNKNKPQRCYAVSLDHDEWSYTLNNNRKRAIPKGARKITIEIEQK